MTLTAHGASKDSVFLVQLFLPLFVELWRAHPFLTIVTVPQEEIYTLVLNPTLVVLEGIGGSPNIKGRLMSETKTHYMRALSSLAQHHITLPLSHLPDEVYP